MFERLKSLWQKQSRSGGVIFSGTRQAQWMKRRYKEFAEEGYQKNVVAYMAINKVSRAAAAIPFQLFRGDQEITDHPLLSLLARPNPMQSGSEYMQALVGFYLIAGNAYIERTVVNGQPRELYTLRPDRMKVTPGPMGLPRGYTYTVGQDSVSWESDPMTGESDIRHLKAFNPLDDWYGMSPIEAGAFAVDQHNESMQWMQALLQNGAAPSGVLEYTKEGQLGDDEYARLKAEIDEQYGGSRNTGRPMLLEGMSWKQMGFNPDQMAALETRYASARDIALAFGVSPLLLNIPGDSTYSNYREARLALYEETVLPLMDFICDELNAWLVPAFGDRLRLSMDIDSVPAIAEKRREMWAMADRSQDLTINERREIKGYEAITGGDEVLVPANLLPLGAPLDMPAGPAELDSALGPEDLKAIAYGEAKDDGHRPTEAMATEAQRGLDWRREHGRGGTDVGVARARDISNRANLSLSTVRRMHSFFSRHEESSKQAEGFRPGEDGYPSAGRIAWALWGGDAGQRWARAIVERESD